MLTPETLPHDLPWQPHAYLLLDGVSVNNLQAKVHQWFGTPHIQVLYATTPLTVCSALSPCLISLNGLHTPGLRYYFAHIAEEWGYLIFSHDSAFDVIRHLRGLLDAEYTQGQKVWLRVADPAVMQAVLSHATRTQKPEVFGPMDRVVLPDVINNTWQHHIRPGYAVRALPEEPYVLCETQQALLDEVRFRSSIKVPATFNRPLGRSYRLRYRQQDSHAIRGNPQLFLNDRPARQRQWGGGVADDTGGAFEFGGE